MKTLCINPFVNLKVEQLQKMIVYEIDYNNCERVFLGESKRPLKSRSDEHNRSARNCYCDKNKIEKDCCEANHNFS